MSDEFQNNIDEFYQRVDRLYWRCMLLDAIEQAERLEKLIHGQIRDFPVAKTRKI